MNLQMNAEMAEGYKSNSQKIRVITEHWTGQNLFCPYCGNAFITHFENNRPAADFYCPDCLKEYELKSRSGSVADKVNDGAYHTMIDRINSANNPNFFFMSYRKENMKVKNMMLE